MLLLKNKSKTVSDLEKLLGISKILSSKEDIYRGAKRGAKAHYRG